MPRRPEESEDEAGDRYRRCPPRLAIGVEMPCHAFTDKLLLLARGERIITATQLERLSRPDVIFSNEPPQSLTSTIEERQRALGILPLSTRLPDDTDDDSAAFTPPVPLIDELAPGTEGTPLHVEIVAAREIRRHAMRQVSELVEQARAGRPLDLQPVRGTVRQVLASLRRNEQAFASLLRLKSLDTYTYTHSVNSCVLSVVLAQRSGLASEAEVIGLGALMHDIGKVRLPESLLHKPGKLTELEWEMVKQHPIVGMEIVDQRTEMHRSAADAVLQHHERLDGSGYPAGLKGAAVSPAGRMVAIADVYDAMTSERPYHQAIAAPDAMRWVCQHAGQLFDPELVRAFIDAIGLFPVGSLVRLSTGELAIVATVNPLAIRRPTVLVVSTSDATTLSARWAGSAQASFTAGDVEPHMLDLNRGGRMQPMRDIVGIEDAASFGLDVDEYLSVVPTLAEETLAALDRLA